MTSPRIVVTGGTGVLGTALRAWLPEATYLTHAECDVRVPRAVHAALASHAPEVVVHATAITDHATPDAASLIATNIEGTRHVTQWCRMAGVRLVYLSTHYVYGPEAPAGGWREWDAPNPIGAYAWSKRAGEAWAARVPDMLIVRGSWYTPASRIATWLTHGVLTDAWCSREPAARAAQKIAALILARASGTINIGGPRRTFAEIVRDEGYDTLDVRYVRRAELALPYPFPLDTSVNTATFDALHLSLPEPRA